MSEYEKRLDKLTEMFEDNANNLTPLMFFVFTHFIPLFNF